jgi:hypothetical protein
MASFGRPFSFVPPLARPWRPSASETSQGGGDASVAALDQVASGPRIRPTVSRDHGSDARVRGPSAFARSPAAQIPRAVKRQARSPRRRSSAASLDHARLAWVQQTSVAMLAESGRPDGDIPSLHRIVPVRGRRLAASEKNRRRPSCFLVSFGAVPALRARRFARSTHSSRQRASARTPSGHRVTPPNPSRQSPSRLDRDSTGEGLSPRRHTPISAPRSETRSRPQGRDRKAPCFLRPASLGSALQSTR